MDRREIRREAAEHGRLEVGKSLFSQSSVELFGARKVLDGSKTIAARVTKRVPMSGFVVVGDAPAGFGNQIPWDPADKELAITAFINPADPLGVMISGVKATDTITFVDAEGQASFAEETENEGLSSLIGLVAAGADATADVFHAPEVKPLIDAAGKFAEDRFKEKPVKAKVRTALGQDPESGHRARQEGGVLVSLPEARQIFYSGDSDHKRRWIKEPGTRDDAHRPDHVRNAFFLRTGHDSRTASADGNIFIYAWDYQFGDNFGVYRLNMLLRRGTGKFPDVD